MNIHDHPFYSRWASIHDRCYNANIKAYASYGGRGIKVDSVWHRDNPDGLRNFGSWVESELKKRPHLKRVTFKVARIEVDGDYGPNNCHLTTTKVSAQNRTSGVLDAETVISIRRFIKENATISLTDVAAQYKVSLANLSRAARGLTWANVNHIEPPVASK